MRLKKVLVDRADYTALQNRCKWFMAAYNQSYRSLEAFERAVDQALRDDGLGSETVAMLTAVLAEHAPPRLRLRPLSKPTRP